MRPNEPRRAYAIVGGSDAWTVPFLREVGAILLRGPPGAALALERVGDGRETLLVPSDGWVDSVVRRSAERVPVRLAARSPPPSADPPDGRATRLGFLAPSATPPPSPRWRRRWGEGSAHVGPDRSTLADRTETDLPDGMGIATPWDPARWVATQVHWFAGGPEGLGVRVRFLVASDEPVVDAAAWSLGVELARGLEATGAPSTRVVVRPPSRRDLREWSVGALRRVRVGPPLILDPPQAAVAGSFRPGTPDTPQVVTDLHAIVIGASGSGKSGLLAEQAARWIASGRSAIVLDLHGDLAPSILARLTPDDRPRVFAVDAAGPPERIPGVALLSGSTGRERDREVALVVAALRRVASDGGETFWGPRLERIFDTFVRAAQEEGGGLLDVHALLTDVRRREACRAVTRSAEVARFLDELPSLVRRNPEFLWSAAARTSKAALDPRLASLLAPSTRDACDVAALLDASRSIVWRLPLGELGPEGAQLAANLLLAHVYLRRTSVDPTRATQRPVLVVLDEAHLFAAPLVTEILAEGRKFGVRAILATQYPERLALVARSAAAGAVGTHMVFRVPPPAAAAAGAWVGLGRDDSVRVLPSLPPGVAVVASAGTTPLRRLVRLAAPPGLDDLSWSTRVDASSPPRTEPVPEGLGQRAREEDLVLELLAAERHGGVPDDLRSASAADPCATSDAAVRVASLDTLVRRGWIEARSGRWSVTTAGLLGIGLTTQTGAARETDEHRALLLHAFLVLARRGVRLTIVRQGRFDARVPDGRVELMGPAPTSGTPKELSERIDRLKGTWGWRTFGGRDAHIEAEVSGADRPDRIRRDVEKARSRSAFLVVVVSRPERARKVRAMLDRLRVRREDAQVWTLPAARRDGPAP